jgi:hypothetical protein
MGERFVFLFLPSNTATRSARSVFRMSDTQLMRTAAAALTQPVSLFFIMFQLGRSEWPRGIRHRSAAGRLLSFGAESFVFQVAVQKHKD